MMTTKPTYLITDMRCNAEDKNTLLVREKKTEASAIKEAKELLKSNTDDEVWIWRLSHIVSRPDAEPNVEKGKAMTHTPSAEMLALAEQLKNAASVRSDTDALLMTSASDFLRLAASTPDYKEAIDTELVMCHLGIANDNPREELNQIINWHVDVALDPRVSERARELIASSDCAAGREAVARYRRMGDQQIYSGAHVANILELYLDRTIAVPDGREEIQAKDGHCPTCDSPDPARHPAVQFEGEVQICKDRFHSPGPSEAITTEQLRCEVTHNPCGSDTWVVGQPCTCKNCTIYLRAADSAGQEPIWQYLGTDGGWYDCDTKGDAEKLSAHGTHTIRRLYAAPPSLDREALKQRRDFLRIEGPSERGLFEIKEIDAILSLNTASVQTAAPEAISHTREQIAGVLLRNRLFANSFGTLHNAGILAMALADSIVLSLTTGAGQTRAEIIEKPEGSK